MKKFLLVSFVAASLMLPLIAKEDTTKTESVKSEQVAPSEQKLIDEVLSDYREGRYNNFLNSINASYKEKSKNWEFNSALEERKKLSEMVTDYQGEKGDDFKKDIAALHEAQNRELVEVCIDNPREKISSEVRDMVFFSPNPHELESIEYVHQLSNKFKGDGVTPLENKLINIDTEFWLKGLSIGVALTQGQIDQVTFQKQYLVLQVEKIKQMKDACQGDLVDVKIKSYIDTAAEVLPKVKASASTRQYLTALGREKVAPKCDAEKEMQEIMTNYLQKEDALVEKHFQNSQ